MSAMNERSALASLELRREIQTMEVPFREVSRDLSELVARMIEASGRWVLVLEAGVNEAHYVQVLTEHDDEILLAECVSNEFLVGAERLTDEQEELLPTLGWDWPSPPNQPNWSTIEFNRDVSLELARQVAHTLSRVFGCTKESRVKVTIFPGTSRRLSLCQLVKNGVHCNISAEMGEDGSLKIEGKELALGVYGSLTCDEYEYRYSILKEDLPRAVEALGGEKSQNVMDVLSRRWIGEIALDIGKVLGDANIETNLDVFIHRSE